MIRDIIILIGRTSMLLLLALFMEAMITYGRALEIDRYTPMIWFIQFLVFNCCLFIAIKIDEKDED